MSARREISGWGRHPWREADCIEGENLERASVDASLSRGLGRAYGDAALPEGPDDRVLVTPHGDRVIAFDEQSGVLRAEAGFSLGGIGAHFPRRGWFSPVSTGTRHVTLGGMVASDVHGKNHHVAGTFGRHVRALRLRTGDGRIIDCDRENHPELFLATCGGMGLTGHILEVELALEKIPSPWIFEEHERLDNLEEIFTALRQASDDWPMTMAWIDTSARGKKMGRGVINRGRWATAEEAPPHPPKPSRRIAIPFEFPNGLANPFTFRILNALYFRKASRKIQRGVINPEFFFWILDGFEHWNRVYGRRGFFQYQAVLPSDLDVFRAFLERFQAMGACSFVTVLKDCGPEGEGMLSFPKQGTSLALDIPIKNPAWALEVNRELNRFTLEHGGRIYLAKDAFTQPEELAAMYPQLEAWKEVRREYDPKGKIRSALSARCGLDL